MFSRAAVRGRGGRTAWAGRPRGVRRDL